MWGPLATLVGVISCSRVLVGVRTHNPTDGCGSLLETLQYRKPTRKNALPI